MYKFVIPIGDWSEDGHGKHDDYVVTSNKPVEAVREAHYRILAATASTCPISATSTAKITSSRKP